jgi:hypothetical protein
MTLAEHAAKFLRENGHSGVMWGDATLTHDILTAAGWKHRGYRSNKLLLNALDGSPLFEKKLVYVGGRVVRDFHLRENRSEHHIAGDQSAVR